jgi:hypothetical protein
MTTRIRLYRSRRMLTLLVGGDGRALSDAWRGQGRGGKCAGFPASRCKNAVSDDVTHWACYAWPIGLYIHDADSGRGPDLLAPDRKAVQ